MSFVFLFIPIVWWGIGDLGSTAALLLVLPDITFDEQEWDKNMSGTITLEQMREIFRIYKVRNHTHIYVCPSFSYLGFQETIYQRKCNLILSD